MFSRVLWQLVRGNRGRLAVALIAVASGAAVISALLNVEFDIGRKLAQEFRVLGANLVVSAESNAPTIVNGPSAAVAGAAAKAATPGQRALAASPTLMDQGVLSQIDSLRTSSVVGAAPYLYVVARADNTPVVVTGTWLDQLRKLEPTWQVEGAWVDSREGPTPAAIAENSGTESACLIGRNVARQFALAPGGHITLEYMAREAQLRVAGVVDAGGTDDDQIFVALPVAQSLAGLPGKIEVVQLSVSGTAQSISAYAARLADAIPGYAVRPIPQVTEAEGNLLNRTRLLIFSMVLLILVLTALCVLATMAALAMERREDVGLMKALGGSISRIVGLFLAEVSVLGAVGGLIGCIAGIVLAQWMGQRVFGTSITPRWEIFPLTIAMMVIVALAGALPLRMLGKVKPAVILRGE
jgi:putative ABC transport system permease protein